MFGEIRRITQKNRTVNFDCPKKILLFQIKNIFRFLSQSIQSILEYSCKIQDKYNNPAFWYEYAVGEQQTHILCQVPSGISVNWII